MRFNTGITSLDFICGSLGCLLIYRLFILTCKSRIPKGFRLPPGPPGKLIIGNLFDMPKHNFWETYDRWAKEYGDLVYVDVFGQPIVFVNSYDVARDLFEQRSSIYSDRPRSTIVDHLMKMDWNLGVMPYGQRWRRHRRMAHQHFHPAAITKYQHIQRKQTQVFLQKLKDFPANFIPHLRFLTGAIIMEVVYGIKVLPKGDPYIETVETGARAAAEALVPGKYLVEFIPLLRYIPEWMPGAEFRRITSKARKATLDMVEKPFTVVRAAFDGGTAAPSIASSLLEDLAQHPDAPIDEETVIRNVTGMTYAAGADTTVSILTSFVLAMVLYPAVQCKAQAELDSVIGDRLPTLEDFESLPYVSAVCKESHRWHPASPLGFPHRVMIDDTYGKYFIPKGSIIMGNAWTMLHDENTYGLNTSDFAPERFLKSGVNDPTAQFGFGRRICPGRYMADIILQITIASILKVFDIVPAQDENGKDIPVKAAFISAILSHAQPFSCTFIPRAEFEQYL